ncbi:hypothetical protein AgCh_016395 [Apium graveolens]
MTVKQYTRPSGGSFDARKNKKVGKTPGQRKTPNDHSMYCDYCHLNSHLRDTCFCLHRYSSWHKMYGKPKPKPKYDGNKPMVSTTHERGNRDSAPESPVTNDIQTNCGLSESQYKQLLSMLQPSLKADSSGLTSTWPASANSVNAGHFNPNYFAVLNLPNGQSAQVTHKGSITLSPDLNLNHVLCVPSFTYNLLSICRFLTDSKLLATFTAHGCYLQDLT